MFLDLLNYCSGVFAPVAFSSFQLLFPLPGASRGAMGEVHLASSLLVFLVLLGPSWHGLNFCIKESAHQIG